MALSATTLIMSAGVNYTATTDSSVDWSAVTNNTYFYDKTTKLTYYKTSGGVIVGAYDTFTGGTVNDLTATTISATTYQNLPTDVNVTGGTYSAGTITFTNNTGGTFNVTGLTTGSTATITGATSVGTGVTIFDSVVNGNIQINSITGDTLEKITTSLSSNTIQVGINEQNLTLWPLVVNGNRLIDGSVSYVSGLTFDISPLNYIIDGSLYNIPSSSQVTLNSGDSTFDRIDVIFADISGNTGVLEGTPSANPEKPIVDSETQVEITFVSVPANSTTPTISTELIYDEFTGEPTEWNFLKFGNQTFRISGDSTAQSYSGSKSISVSGLTTSGGSWSNGFVLSATSLTDTNQFATLQFAIRNMSGNSNNTQIRIRFLNQIGSPISSPVYLWGSSTTGQYVNYSASNTSSWQLISIPLWKFYLTNTNVYGVRFDYAVGSLVARHYFDKIELVEGTASSPPSNSWTTIKGDGATTITAPNPNATLTISGGTNIGSFISGTSTVVLNLDNNINLNGVTASTISATTYQNLPISGTHDYLSKFSSGSTILVDSQIRDNGSTVGLGLAPNVNIKFVVNTTTEDYSISGINSKTSGVGVYGESNGLGNVLGVSGLANGLGTSNIGVNGQANNATTNIGLKGYAFNGTNNYSIQLQDGTEGIGKVLTSVTSDGKANWQTLPTDVRVTGATYSNNTFTYTNNTGGTFNVLFNTLTGLTVNGNLTVTGNTNVRSFTGTTGYISGSGQNILTVIGSGNSTTSPLFSVQGSSGELFSVTDSLTGSLFSVNDISGLPIMEVFSDNTTLWGSYQAPSLNTTTRTSLTAGTNTIYSIPTSAYTGVFYEYTLISSGATGARAGQIMSIWSGSTANFTETTTTDIGTTTGVTFTVAVSGNNAVLSSSATTAGWTVKTIIRSI